MNTQTLYFTCPADASSDSAMQINELSLWMLLEPTYEEAGTIDAINTY